MRLTGGEPLVRRDVERLIAMLAPLGAELTLTTNASLLAAKAQALAAAGLHRVTVSLDSLDDATFRAMNDVDFPVSRVLDGIEAAAAAGLPVKVNAVVKRGLNDDGILAMAALLPRAAATRSASSSTWTSARRTAGGSTTSSRRPRSIERISAELPLEPTEANYRGEVAKRWRYADGSWRDRRDRVRDAALLRRLHARADLGRGPALHLSLRAPRPRPRALGSAAAPPTRSCSEALSAIWGKRTDRYSELRSEATVNLPKVEMSYIGG